MSADFDSDLRRRLENLGADTGMVSLAGPDAARRRAHQRTRNQVIGTVLGAAVIVGGGVIAFAQPDVSSAPQFANTPSDSVSTTSTPSPTPTATDPTPSALPEPGNGPLLPESVLLTAADLQQEDNPAEWHQVETPAEPWACAPAAPGEAENRQVLQRSFGTDGSRLDQVVEASDPQWAATRFDEIRDAVTECVDALGDGYGFGWISAFTGLGDDAWQASYFAPPRDGDAATLVHVDLVRTGIAVTSVASGALAMDDNYPPLPDRAIAATARLCAEAGGACVADAERQLLYPEGAQDLAGWLTPDDVVETTGLAAISQASEAVPRDDGSLGFVCFEQNAVADGATSLLGRFYVDPTDPAGLSVEEVIGVFPTGGEALAYYLALAAQGDSCSAEPGISVQNTGADAAGPLDASGFTTWRAASTSTGSTWVLGLAVDVPVVIFVNYGVQGGEDVSAAQMQALLERAVQRYANP